MFPPLSRRAFLRALGVAAGSGAFDGQQGRLSGIGQAPRVFRSDVELVTTAATVTDEAGRLVTTLGRDDFEILEDGRPQRLAQFTNERVPVSLGLARTCSAIHRTARPMGNSAPSVSVSGRATTGCARGAGPWRSGDPPAPERGEPRTVMS